MINIGFLASGSGSSAQAIVKAAAEGELAVAPKLLVSNRAAAPALQFAQEAGLATLLIPTRNDPAEADRQLVRAMVDHGVDLVVMSGYLRRLGPAVLRRFSDRILNIHPGPLPAFGGEGMYGRRVHEAVLAARLRETAIVIHLVDSEYDHGQEVARLGVPVLRDDSVETLEARVRAAEPSFYVRTLQRIVCGELALPAAIISDNIP